MQCCQTTSSVQWKLNGWHEINIILFPITVLLLATPVTVSIQLKSNADLQIRYRETEKGDAGEEEPIVLQFHVISRSLEAGSLGENAAVQN